MPSNPKGLTTDKSAATIRRELGRLRTLIETTDDPVTQRVAWAMEQAIRWATERTRHWHKPAEEAADTAKLIRKESADAQ